MRLLTWNDDDRPFYLYDVAKNKTRPRQATHEYHFCQFCGWWGKILHPTDRGDMVDFNLPHCNEADILEETEMLGVKNIYCPACGKRGDDDL